jgi:hypothetical protein
MTELPILAVRQPTGDHPAAFSPVSPAVRFLLRWKSFTWVQAVKHHSTRKVWSGIKALALTVVRPWSAIRHPVLRRYRVPGSVSGDANDSLRAVRSPAEHPAAVHPD